MSEQQSPCHQHVELLDAIGAKTDEEAKLIVNGLRTRLHTALNDAAGAGMLLESIRSQLKCENVLDIPEAIDALVDCERVHLETVAAGLAKGKEEEVAHG